MSVSESLKSQKQLTEEWEKINHNLEISGIKELIFSALKSNISKELKKGISVSFSNVEEKNDKEIIVSNIKNATDKTKFIFSNDGWSSSSQNPDFVLSSFDPETKKTKKILNYKVRGTKALDEPTIQNKALQTLITQKDKNTNISDCLGWFVAKEDFKNDCFIFVYDNSGSHKPVGWIKKEDLYKSGINCDFITKDFIKKTIKDNKANLSPDLLKYLSNIVEQKKLQKSDIRKCWFLCNDFSDRTLYLIPKKSIHRDEVLSSLSAPSVKQNLPTSSIPSKKQISSVHHSNKSSIKPMIQASNIMMTKKPSSSSLATYSVNLIRKRNLEKMTLKIKQSANFGKKIKIKTNKGHSSCFKKM